MRPTSWKGKIVHKFSVFSLGRKKLAYQHCGHSGQLKTFGPESDAILHSGQPKFGASD